MSRRPPSPRSRSRTSLLPNDTDRGAHDLDRQEPPAQHRPGTTPLPSTYDLDKSGPGPASAKMHRQDSGYESTAPPRDPVAHASHASSSRSFPSTRTAGSPGSAASSRDGSRSRPAAKRRPSKSGSVARQPKSAKHGGRSFLLSANQPVTVPPSLYGYPDNSVYQYGSPAYARTPYFHFPSFEAHGAHNADPEGLAEHAASEELADEEAAPYQPPPQTTHYWTSDRTRRLEYAAIDAASRGVRGWVMRHVVPGCFVPKAKRHVTFDDDTGSVRRYRLELESEESTEKEDLSTLGGGQKKGRTYSWWS